MRVNCLTKFWKMLVNVLHPLRLLLANISCGTSIPYSPFIDELTNEADLCGNRWNTKLSESPIILVTADGNTHSLFGSTFQCSLREWCFLRNLSKDSKNTWASLLNIILLSTVEWVNESISIRMHINDEGEFIFTLGQEVFVSHGFWLRKSSGTWVISGARVGTSLFVCLLFKPLIFLILENIVNLSEINSKVTVDINARIDLSKATTTDFIIHVFSVADDFVSLDPLVLNKCDTIDIENWDEDILIHTQQFLPFIRRLNFTFLEELQKLINVKGC